MRFSLGVSIVKHELLLMVAPANLSGLTMLSTKAPLSDRACGISFCKGAFEALEEAGFDPVGFADDANGLKTVSEGRSTYEQIISETGPAKTAFHHWSLQNRVTVETSKESSFAFGNTIGTVSTSKFLGFVYDSKLLMVKCI